jgi:hypothetical protein
MDFITLDLLNIIFSCYILPDHPSVRFCFMVFDDASGLFQISAPDAERPKAG